MDFWKVIFVLFLTVNIGVLAAPIDDLITYLPGIDPQPSFAQYAGYLEGSENDHYFYWFVESENDPANDPVVLWLNGGPGCSSMTGFLSENGPFRSHVDGTLSYFEYNWNKNASMIFMDAPACVGFSYSDLGTCISGDDMAADKNHEAMRDFFLNKFTEYNTNDFYITGESYAGVYIPMLAQRVIDDTELNFQGFMVGNGVTDNDVMDSGLVYFEYGNGMFSEELWFELVDECCGGNATHCYFSLGQGARCLLLMGDVYYHQWNTLNPYAMYQPCYGGIVDFEDPQLVEYDGRLHLPFPYGLNLRKETMDKYEAAVQRYRDDGIHFYGSIPCTNTADRENYLNRPDVKQALHVAPQAADWEACTSLTYNRNYSDMAPFYNHVLHHPNGGKRTWMYYGDTDLACITFSGTWFMEDNLNQIELSNHIRWFYQDDLNTTQTAGYFHQYDKVNYISVLGSGHMVPTDSPKRALMIFDYFLSNNADMSPN